MFPGFSFWIVQRLDLQGSLSSLLGSRNGRCHMPSSNEVDQPLAGRLILFCGSIRRSVCWVHRTWVHRTWVHRTWGLSARSASSLDVGALHLRADDPLGS